jgi:signal transduction histidine kinase/DNA-binding response OmpR family regulator
VSGAGGDGSRSLTKIVIGLFTATALLLGGVFVVLLVSVVNLRADDRNARSSSDLLLASFAVERSVVDLETGVRGFLLTGQSSFLAPYVQARERLPAQLASLRQVAGRRGKQVQVNEIAGAISSYIQDYAQPLLVTGARLSAAQKAAATSRGKQLVDGLRARFNLLDAGQLALRERNRAGATGGSTLALVAAAVGLVISLALLLGQRIYLLTRILRPMRVAGEAARRLSTGDLAVRVPTTGAGEVSTLSESFNVMADAVEAREVELSSAHARLERAVHQARDASAMKSNFLANMSHEIRTPLNGVIGMMNLLADTELSAEQREYVDAARSSGDGLMTVVNDILDLAKIEAGRLEVLRRDFDLYDMVESTCDMVAASALSKGLELQSFVHDDVPRAVRGDRMRVSQVLSNLLSNAVKFTAEGEVVVEVSTAEEADDRVGVRFEVRDTGMGIPPDRIRGLFEPFTQADAGTTREFGGTGLGLTISRELTQLMGGTIEAKSKVADGSTFSFTIPFEPAHAQLPTPVPAAGLRGLRVLVVDDNATNRRVFEAYLASWEMRPDVARDAQEATAKLHAAVRDGDPFDLALLDFNMPGENGVQLARRISASSSLHRTRLILVTSSGHPEADAAASGIRNHLTKPVRQSRLLDAISLAMAPEMHDHHELGREPQADVPARSSPGAGSRILVGEDQDVNWLLIERMLAKRGHVAINARDGRRTVEMLELGNYDLVLMDCQMPVLDGYSATREIRRREAAEHRDHVPIVAMTAHAMVGDRQRCVAAGMDDYIAKPISAEELDALLTRWLPSKDAGASLDRARLEELRSLFPGEEMPTIVRKLVTDLRQQIGRISTAIDAGDRVVVADAAHRVINSARMIGATELARAASRLEHLAADEHADGDIPLQPAVNALSDRWRATATAVEAELGV